MVESGVPHSVEEVLHHTTFDINLPDRATLLTQPTFLVLEIGNNLRMSTITVDLIHR